MKRAWSPLQVAGACHMKALPKAAIYIYIYISHEHDNIHEGMQHFSVLGGDAIPTDTPLHHDVFGGLIKCSVPTFFISS